MYRVGQAMAAGHQREWRAVLYDVVKEEGDFDRAPERERPAAVVAAVADVPVPGDICMQSAAAR